MFVGFVVFAAVLVAAVFGAGAGAGLLPLGPLFLIIKIGFLLMVFGAFGRGLRGRGRRDFVRHDWQTRSPAGTERGPSQEEFDEWHRLTHARQEVDGWVDGVV